jgi:thiosulfate/3-mercaptopyruvate sulfurtransferase
MEKSNPTSPLVSVDWLAEHLHQPNLVVLDASLPPIGKQDAPKETSKIPTAVFFDIENVFSDSHSHLPHTMLSPEEFTHKAQNLGIHQDSLIVVYDTVGVYSSPRAWWMFRAMGHQQVFVLNGGLPAWKQAELKCEPIDSTTIRKSGNFIADYQSNLFKNAQDILTALEDTSQLIIDARSEDRFLGKVAEPRAGLRRGHIPHAVNLPFSTIIEGNFMLDKSSLTHIYADLVGEEKALVFSCGSGVTACILALGAEVAGYSTLSVYDGSWSEWGLPSDLPIATG